MSSSEETRTHADPATNMEHGHNYHHRRRHNNNNERFQQINADGNNSNNVADDDDQLIDSDVTTPHCHDDAVKEPAEDMSLISRRKLIIACFICFAFMSAEIAGGLLSGSLAIMTDALHLLTDLVGFGIGVAAITLGKKPATRRLTFGWYRAEVLGALISVLLVWAITAILVFMAVERIISNTYEIEAQIMLVTSSLGVCINLLMGIQLQHGGHGHSHGFGGGHGHSHGGQGGESHSHHEHSHGHHHHNQQSAISPIQEETDRYQASSAENNNNPSSSAIHQQDQEYDKRRSSGSQSQEVACEIATAIGTPGVVAPSDVIGQSVNMPQPSNKDGDIIIPVVDDETTEASATSSAIVATLQTFSVSTRRSWSMMSVTSSEYDDDTNKASVKPETDMNVRAAVIHILGDLGQSVGVMIAALIIYFNPEYKIADPICTFVFSVIVLITTITVMRDVFHILMEGTPRNVDYEKMKDDLLHIHGVRSVHNMRIWTLTVSKIAASAHIGFGEVRRGERVNYDDVLQQCRKMLQKKYGIADLTLQVEQHSKAMDNCGKCKPPASRKK